MISIIYPPNYMPTDGNPVIFLAGPIQDAPDWQIKAIRYIQENAKIDVDIACPRRFNMFEKSSTELLRQINWESYYLEKASNSGVILFWLSNMIPDSQTVSFARTTRFELGEWFTKSKFLNTKIVVGIDSEFPGKDYIISRFKSMNHFFEFHDNLNDTCKHALSLL